MLLPSQYSAFEEAMQQAFGQIYKCAQTHIQVGGNGRIQLTCCGVQLDTALAKSEEQATELAYRATLAKVLDKKLVLFRQRRGWMNLQPHARVILLGACQNTGLSYQSHLMVVWISTAKK